MKNRYIIIGIFTVLILLVFYKIQLFPRDNGCSIGVIGGADGPTAIFVSSKLIKHNIWKLIIATIIIITLISKAPSLWQRK